METIKIILKGIGKILGFMLEAGADIEDMKSNIYQPTADPFKHYSSTNKDGFNYNI